MDKPTTVKEYIANIPEDRLVPFKKLHKTIKQSLPKGFNETLSYGMPGWVVPLKSYPEGYHCKPEQPLPFANLANQKNFIALYNMGLYADKGIYDWFVNAYPEHCKYKLDMGKSCIRFKKLDDIPYELIAELMSKFTVDQWIDLYEKTIKK